MSTYVCAGPIPVNRAPVFRHFIHSTRGVCAILPACSLGTPFIIQCRPASLPAASCLASPSVSQRTTPTSVYASRRSLDRYTLFYTYTPDPLEYGTRPRRLWAYWKTIVQAISAWYKNLCAKSSFQASRKFRRIFSPILRECMEVLRYRRPLTFPHCFLWPRRPVHTFLSFPLARCSTRPIAPAIQS